MGDQIALSWVDGVTLSGTVDAGGALHVTGARVPRSTPMPAALTPSPDARGAWRRQPPAGHGVLGESETRTGPTVRPEKKSEPSARTSTAYLPPPLTEPDDTAALEQALVATSHRRLEDEHAFDAWLRSNDMTRGAHASIPCVDAFVLYRAFAVGHGVAPLQPLHFASAMLGRFDKVETKLRRGTRLKHAECYLTNKRARISLRAMAEANPPTPEDFALFSFNAPPSPSPIPRPPCPNPLRSSPPPRATTSAPPRPSTRRPRRSSSGRWPSSPSSTWGSRSTRRHAGGPRHRGPPHRRVAGTRTTTAWSWRCRTSGARRPLPVPGRRAADRGARMSRDGQKDRGAAPTRTIRHEVRAPPSPGPSSSSGRSAPTSSVARVAEAPAASSPSSFVPRRRRPSSSTCGSPPGPCRSPPLPPLPSSTSGELKRGPTPPPPRGLARLRLPPASAVLEGPGWEPPRLQSTTPRIP
jgi:hypothetical protein